MRIADAAPAVASIALSAVVAFGTLGLGLWDGFTPGPAFVPVLVAAAGTILAVLQLIEMRHAGDAGGSWPDRKTLACIAMTVAGLVAFAVLAPLAGTIASAAMLMLFLLVVVLRQRPWPSLLAVGITTGVIYCIFVLWLGLLLPKGITGI